MFIDGVGVWAPELRYGDAGAIAEAAAELEELGFTAQWVPDVGGDLFGAVANLLAATERSVVATGILNLWLRSAADTGSEHARLTAAHGNRFLVGIGVSHSALVDNLPDKTYAKPLTTMADYLDDLDAGEQPLPVSDRVLAALGPRMLGLARDRARGAHPYLVTPDHTARAREVLGTGPLLAPEQKVVLETDPSVARDVGRSSVSHYLALPNYARNLQRLGFSEADLAGGGSDRLIDALVAWGDESAIADRVQAHRDAGADHVCIQVLRKDAEGLPIAEWRRVAAAVVG